MAAAIKKCTIRYGTNFTPSFAKFIDIVPPTLQDFENAKLFPENEGQRVSDKNEKLKLKRPSLSAILGSIDDKKGLYLWQKQMIDEMGLSGFRSTMTERMALGTKTHSRIENLLKIRANFEHSKFEIKKEIENEKNREIAKYMKSAVPIINEIDIGQDKFVLTEKSVKHPLLAYQGRFDAIFSFKGELSIADWKTAPARSSFSKQKEESLSYSSYSRQLAAYASAFNYDERFQNLPFIRRGLIISLKEDGSTAEVFEITEDEMKSRLEDVKKSLKLFWAQIEEAQNANIDFAYKE